MLISTLCAAPLSGSKGRPFAPAPCVGRVSMTARPPVFRAWKEPDGKGRPGFPRGGFMVSTAGIPHSEDTETRADLY